MRVSRIELVNWKNFKSVKTDLPDRVFLVGPNASGKSNFLDAFRFLRDIAVSDGTFQKACKDRGGVLKILCLAARQKPEIEIAVELTEGLRKLWRYELAFSHDNNRNPRVTREVVWNEEVVILRRPDEQDKKDPFRLSQTALEQVNTNQPFREIVQFFETISYLHIVPQILRNPGSLAEESERLELHGRNFLERVAKTPAKTRDARLRKIQQGLSFAVPQLKELQLERDRSGVPHLVGRFEHWRAHAKQTEDQFSDGTLRLLGLLWALQEGDGPLLLEEPELSLHQGVVQRLAAIFYRLQKKAKKQRQVIITTHSADLLSEGVGGEEILILKPGSDGTKVTQAKDIAEIRMLLEAGVPAGRVVLPHTEGDEFAQLELFS